MVEGFFYPKHKLRFHLESGGIRSAGRKKNRVTKGDFNFGGTDYGIGS
jgi:hypothetical protein